jgi:4-amino-4-deoxy-L-arabinose transferase-like glycosyltransferase
MLCTDQEKFKTVTFTPRIRTFFALYALVNILFVVFLWFNHVAFPLNLEAMELTVLQHLRRILSGLPLYAEPSADFVALAYNPLYYLLCVPFAWIFGPNLFTMRLVSILGMLGSGIVIFLAVRKGTNSNWWGLMGVGLFAAAYQVMDTYLDNAHSDSCLLFIVLLGCYLIEQNRSRGQNFLGLLLMVMAFWVKQHGALFAMGAVVYLTWRDGWRKSWPYWIVAVVLGPGLYWSAPQWLFGPFFHYFTWDVPRRWSDFSLTSIQRLLEFIARFYFVLAIVGAIASISALVSSRKQLSIWYFMLPIAMLSGLMGALDVSNNNVFIPMGTWFILTGILGLKQLTHRSLTQKRWTLRLCAIGLSFALFLYNPIPTIVSPQASTAYQDLLSVLKSFNGSVYAPWIGQLQEGYKFYPAAHGVPMEDLIRGPGIDVRNNPKIRKLMEPVLNPKGKAYLLLNYPLAEDNLLEFLAEKYVFEQDFGNRFASLTTLPKRFTLRWPRYLYRYAPKEAAKQALLNN